MLSDSHAGPKDEEKGRFDPIAHAQYRPRPLKHQLDQTREEARQMPIIHIPMQAGSATRPILQAATGSGRGEVPQVDVTPADMFDALRLHIRSFPRVPTSTKSRPIISHVCDGKCPFTQYKSLVICRDTGNIHVCNNKDCNRIIEMRDARVCELTSVAYPLDHVLSVDSEETSTITRVTNPVRKLPVVAAVARKKKKKLDIRKPAIQFAPVKFNYHLFEAQAHNIIGKAIDPAGLKLQGTRWIVTICLSLWERILSTSVYQQVKGGYRFVNHVYVVLFDMIDGISMNGKTIIEKSPFVREHLYEKRMLKKKNEELFRIHRITKASRLFHACLAEAYR